MDEKEKEKKFTLMDVARMLVSIPLKDSVVIDRAELVIKYHGPFGNECEYRAALRDDDGWEPGRRARMEP